MTIHLVPASDVCADIDDVLNRNRARPIAVYAEAERIRRKFIHKNIALEDIIGQFMARSSAYQTVLEFNPFEAADSLLGNLSDGSSEGSNSVSQSTENLEDQGASNIIDLRSK